MFAVIGSGPSIGSFYVACSLFRAFPFNCGRFPRISSCFDVKYWLKFAVVGCFCFFYLRHMDPASKIESCSRIIFAGAST